MIQFKFGKTAGYDAIQFAGIGMKLSELKAAIIAKRIPSSDPSAPPVDLSISNAETGVGKLPHLSYFDPASTGLATAYSPFSREKRKPGVWNCLVFLPALLPASTQIRGICRVY